MRSTFVIVLVVLVLDSFFQALVVTHDSVAGSKALA
jgi:hypothetical protein